MASIRRWLIGAIGLLLLSPLSAQEERPRIVVDTFENPANHRESTIGNALADIFVTELARTGRFRIIDTTSRGQNESRPDFRFVAKVTNFSYQEKEIAAASADVARRQASAAKQCEQMIDVRIDFRVLDSSQEVLFADTGESQQKNVSATAMVADFHRLVAAGVAVSTSEIMGSMMGRASVEALGRIVARVNDYFDIAGFDRTEDLQGEVIGVIDSGNCVINIGSAAGLRATDQLTVLREDPIRNLKGEVVYSRRVNIGRAMVTDCQLDRALVALNLHVESAVKEGDLMHREAPRRGPHEHRDKGRRFLEKAFFPSALREFQIAQELIPDSTEVLGYLGITHMYMRNYEVGASLLDQMINGGEPLEWHVIHQHALTNCKGLLALSREGIAFRSASETDADHIFQVPFSEVFEVRKRPLGLEIRVPSGAGKPKNWTFTIQGLSGEMQDKMIGYIVSYVIRNKPR
jgi:TolB-like protein